jgi:hypothetical protein
MSETEKARMGRFPLLVVIKISFSLLISAVFFLNIVFNHSSAEKTMWAIWFALVAFFSLFEGFYKLIKLPDAMRIELQKSGANPPRALFIDFISSCMLPIYLVISEYFGRVI